jgi:arginase
MSETLGRTFGLIGAPSSAGAFAPGQEKAPQALRDAGLVRRMKEAAIDVVDHGDLPERRWHPDRDRPRAQNADAVAENATAVAAAVARIVDAAQVPIVLGGDCTVAVGTVAGSATNAGRIGLVYFDLHADLNVPDAVDAGALDWMGVSHLLGEQGTVPELRDIGPRTPLLTNEQVLLFSHGAEQATAHEMAAIGRRALRRVPVEEVRAAPAAVAATVVEAAQRTWDRTVVHLDVDVIDFTDAPLSENPGRNTGLSLGDTFEALGVLLTNPHLAALSIAELNPDHGEEDGSTLDRFVGGLVDCLPRLGET